MPIRTEETTTTFPLKKTAPNYGEQAQAHLVRATELTKYRTLSLFSTTKEPTTQNILILPVTAAESEFTDARAGLLNKKLIKHAEESKKVMGIYTANLSS